MSVAWSVLKAQVGRKLNDSTHAVYSVALLLDCVNDALLAFAASHTGVASTFTITGDGETYEFALPSNIVDEETAGVYAVNWKDSQWMKRIELWPDTEWTSASRTTASNPLAYFLWPAGYINFTRIPVDEQVITLYYVAYYPTVTGDSSIITVPKWAEEAIKLYTCSLALEPSSTKASVLGQYKQRRDSGDPEDNPLLRLSERYMQRYWRILADHQPPQYHKLQPMGV